VKPIIWPREFDGFRFARSVPHAVIPDAGAALHLARAGFGAQEGRILLGRRWGNDLANWAANLGSKFFLRPDAALMVALGQLSSWATSQNYEPAAVNTFLQVADYYLVGHAMAHNHVVVSHEIPSTSTKRIKIPNACIGAGIKCVTPFEMLRVEKARFVLGR